MIIWLYFWTVRHGLVGEIGQAHLSLPVGSGVRVQSLARTNVICTGGTLNPGKPRGFHDPWSFSQDTQVDKMGKPFQIRNTWPLRGKEKVLLRGATQKSFLGRQKNSGFLPRKVPIHQSHYSMFDGSCKCGIPAFCSENFCTSAKTLPRISETCQGVTCVKKSS